MSTPSGWYDDPAPESAPGTVRWWDGRRWTEQTQAAPVQLAKTGAGPGPPQQGAPVGYQGPMAAPVPPVQLTHTPDGMALAGPGKRLGAHLIDAVIVTAASMVLVVLFVVAVLGGGAATGMFDTGSTDEPPPALIAMVLGGYLLLFAGFALISVWYYVIRVRQVGATLGKQMLGLRVRPFHADGQLTWGQTIGRWGLPAVVNGVVGVTFFVDVLWLLWDKHRQCLHDKAVGTVVVDSSAPRVPLDHPGVQYARAFPAPRGWVADGPNPQTPASYPR